MIKRFVAGLFMVALLGGCTDLIVEEMMGPSGVAQGVTAPSPQVTVPRDRSAIYFYRTAQLAGSADSFTIFANETPVAEMSWRSVHVAYVNPGRIDLRAEETPTLSNVGLGIALQKKPKLSLNALPGQVFYVRVGASVMTGGPTLAAVDRSTATSEVTDFRAARPL